MYSLILFSLNYFLPSSQSGLGVSSAQLLALPAFLVSAVDAREAREYHFEEEFEDKEFKCGLEEWYAETRTLEALTKIRRIGLRLCIKKFLSICCLS